MKRNKSIVDLTDVIFSPNRKSMKSIEKKKRTKSDRNSTNTNKYISSNASEENVNFISENVGKVTRIADEIRRRNKNENEVFEGNDREKGTSKRSKRSFDNKSDYVGPEKQVPPSHNKFYRHPNLSYEEQRRLLRDKLKAEALNLKFGSTLQQRVLDVFPSSPLNFHTEFPHGESATKHSHIPVFKRNDTNNSEVDDLNRPGPSSDSKNDDTEEDEADKSLKILNKHSEPQVSLDQDHSIVSTSVKEQRKDNGYINIRDHQKNTDKTTSSDILEYDPDKIPYVDVPDYSDIREESLDEQDRRDRTKKKNNDPKVPTDFRELNFSTVQGNEKDQVKTRKNSQQPSVKLGKNVTDTEHGDGAEGKPEEAIKELNFRMVKGNKKDQLKVKKNSQLPSVKLEANVKNTEDRNGAEGNSTVESDIFDINEYRKPFNLDEFLKDDPIMKKLELLEKETRSMYGESRKRVSDYFNESESDNAYKDPAARREDPAEEQGFDHTSRSSRTSDFDDNFANDKRNNMKRDEEIHEKSETRSREEFDETDDDFTTSIFKDEKEHPSRLENKGESLSRYFMDVARNLPDEGTGRHRRKKNALSAILSKKTRVSLLQGNDKRIKGDEPRYKNIWHGQHKSQRRKLVMKDQEKRKELM